MEALVNKSTEPFNPDYYLWAYIIFQGVTLLYFNTACCVRRIHITFSGTEVSNVMAEKY